MPTVHRSARVPYTAQQMYELVNDVESYPEFLHWCRGARIVRRDARLVEAELDIGVRGIHKSFTTRNRLDPPRRIDIELVSGPFRKLEGAWQFEDRAAAAESEVALDLEFRVASTPLAFVFSRAFEEMARQQMNAFVKRARRIYG